MANTHSAVKRNRKTIKRTIRNTSVASAVKTAIKKARAAIAAGAADKDEAVRLATRELARAASKGVLHARNAERRIARLAHAAAKKVAAATATK